MVLECSEGLGDPHILYSRMFLINELSDLAFLRSSETDSSAQKNLYVSVILLFFIKYLWVCEVFYQLVSRKMQLLAYTTR